MHRVKAKTEAEKDKKQTIPQKRMMTDDKMSKPQARRRSSLQRTAMPTSPTAISPHTTHPSLPIIPGTTSPTNTFTPIHTSAQSFTPQSASGSSPGGSELIYPFSLTTQGIYTPFGNSPPLFPVQTQHHVQLPNEITEPPRENDDSGQFWQSLFGPPGSSIQPPQHFGGIPQGFSGQGTSGTGEFREPNNETGTGVELEGVNLDEIDNGLVDWGDFIAQCSQVWVTE